MGNPMLFRKAGEIEIRVSGRLHSASGPKGPGRRTARRFTLAASLAADPDGRSGIPAMVKPERCTSLLMLAGWGALAGRILSDAEAWEAHSHLQFPSFNATFLARGGGWMQ